jgi:hypothetical protein
MNGTKRMGAGKAERKEMTCRVDVESARGWRPNEPLHHIAARLRFLLNLNGYGWAAARERRR